MPIPGWCLPADARPRLLSDPVAEVLEARRTGEPIRLATSGTTMRPRTVVRSTESWWASFPAYSALSGVGPGSRVWVPGPLAGTMNLFAAVHAAAVGARLVDDARSATHACLTPAVLERELERLPRGTRVTAAGATLTADLADRVEAAGHRVAHYYGAAELSFVAAGRDADSLEPFLGVDIEVRSGEIWVRSPYLAQGLGEWATAGDRGELLAGRLQVLGRPDAVTTAGSTVLLALVERALQDAGEGPVTCFGVPHASVGEVLGAATTGDVATLTAYARANLPPDHRPRIWLGVAELPLTDAGKVDRPALQRLAAGRA